MEYPYPRNTVWLIEARETQEPSEDPAMGSAVVVSLRGKDKNIVKYLLTCAHVLKNYVPEENGIASGSLRANVLCWPPGEGYVKFKENDPWPIEEGDGIWTVKEVIDIYNRPAGNWSLEDCSEEKDWILLKIGEASFQQYPDCEFADSTKKLSPYTVIGFPDGSKGLNTGKNVQSRVSKGFESYRNDANPAIMRPEGAWPTGAGMSGGGVFDSQGNLVGLYRGQNPRHLSTAAIKAAEIMDRLWKEGIETFVAETRPDPASVELSNEVGEGLGRGALLNQRNAWLKIIAMLVAVLTVCALAYAFNQLPFGKQAVVHVPIDFNAPPFLPDELPNPNNFSEIPSKAEIENLDEVRDTENFEFTFVNMTEQDFWLLLLNCDLLYAETTGIRYVPWTRIQFPKKLGTEASVVQNNRFSTFEPGTGTYFLVLRDGNGEITKLGRADFFKHKNTKLIVFQSGKQFEHRFEFEN